MELVKLKRSVHGKSAMARYDMGSKDLEVYLQNNKSGTNQWGELLVVCHIVPRGMRFQFTDYAKFRDFRKQLALTL